MAAPQAAPAHEIHLQITAFGPFQGVPDNPSSHLVRALPAHYAQHGRRGVKLLAPVIVETSAVGSLQALQSLPAYSTHSPQVTHVLVHFGVHGAAKRFHVEQIAHNEANFRCNDERQWSPSNQTVVPNAPKTMPSPLSTPVIARTLGAHFPVELSTDPGRFVCNWLYYSSLHLAKTRNEQGSRILPLFVHIPPFNVIPMDKTLVHFSSSMHLTVARISPPHYWISFLSSFRLLHRRSSHEDRVKISRFSLYMHNSYSLSCFHLCGRHSLFSITKVLRSTALARRQQRSCGR